MRVAFIGAVHVELQLADAVQFVHRNTMPLQALGRGLGAGDGTVEGGLVLSQGIDEEVGGRTGTDADDALSSSLGRMKSTAAWATPV